MSEPWISTEIDGYPVGCFGSGVLEVILPGGEKRISVLPTGTHAALDPLGKGTKMRIVNWWKKVR